MILNRNFLFISYYFFIFANSSLPKANSEINTQFHRDITKENSSCYKLNIHQQNLEANINKNDIITNKEKNSNTRLIRIIDMTKDSKKEDFGIKNNKNTNSTVVSYGSDAQKNINILDAKKEQIKEVQLMNSNQLIFNNKFSTTEKDSLKIINAEDFLNRAKGSILGAFVGDSIGSYLEFKKTVTSEDADKALNMPGGGPFSLSPGQITDDSEFAICLLYGLLDGKGRLSLDKIAYHYFKWLTSPPFDIGATCFGGLKPLLKYKNEKNPDCKGWSLQCRQIAGDVNKNSCSNGGLMRITPLAVWCSKLDDIEQMENAIYLEQSFTHPNPITQQAAFTYCLAIRYLLRNQGDIEGAINEVREWINKKGVDEIKKWWDIVEKNTWITEKQSIGWSKIAWTYSFILLKNETDYNKIMKKVLMNGGDTDTNACIVGGLIGAKLGYKKLNDQIPEQCKKLLRYDAPQANRKRPEFLTPRNAFLKIEELVKIAPSKLIII